ncbi:hypothetical protein OpiT1DRAFT_05457 [Opitutaceae bacterium TAV1]|nr:hypothetical protein OpiT1DRAFT_05457 [Opitutaceae bacterium TAV1]
MPNDQIITLNKLNSISHNEGVLKKIEVKIESPAAFVQENACGNLSSFNSLEAYRNAAREIGTQFRAAITA